MSLRGTTEVLAQRLSEHHQISYGSVQLGTWKGPMGEQQLRKLASQLMILEGVMGNTHPQVRLLLRSCKCLHSIAQRGGAAETPVDHGKRRPDS